MSDVIIYINYFVLFHLFLQKSIYFLRIVLAFIPAVKESKNVKQRNRNTERSNSYEVKWMIFVGFPN